MTNTHKPQKGLKSAGVRHTVGMDMVPPYGVYLNGTLLAEHATEKEAGATFDAVRGRQRVGRVFVGQSPG